VTIRRRKVTAWVWSCKCERCSYEWETTRLEPPVRCPGCKAHNWNKAARAYVRKDAAK
jgi:predicted Zn-ribbon and HTH transcriptional regulator